MGGSEDIQWVQGGDSSTQGAQGNTQGAQGEESTPRCLIFVLGEGAVDMCSALRAGLLGTWEQQLSQAASVKLPVSMHGEISVGSYNTLHPACAVKHATVEGIDRNGESNWSARCVAIAQLLLRSALDVYLLQAVSSQQMTQLMLVLDELYECVHYTHPHREAGDGVAVLLSKSKFAIQSHEMVPFLAKQADEKQQQHHMCSCAVNALSITNGQQLLFVSTHIHAKKCLDPQSTLLAYLANGVTDNRSVIWGGDCDDQFLNGIPDGFATARCGQPTSKCGTQKDWIFHSTDIQSGRTKRSEQFVDATRQELAFTGQCASDHFGEAIVMMSSESESKHEPENK